MLTARINGLYMNDHGKIILFNSRDEIKYFIDSFINYAMNRGLAGGADPFSIMSLGNNVIIDEWTEKEEKSCTCETIKYEDLKP